MAMPLSYDIDPSKYIEYGLHSRDLFDLLPKMATDKLEYELYCSAPGLLGLLQKLVEKLELVHLLT